MISSSRYVVTVPEAIELHVGAAPWLRISQSAVSLLGLFSIVSSRTAPLSMLLGLAALLAVHRAALHTMRQNGAAARLTLHANGSAILHSVNGLIQAHRCDESWASRWLCVVTLKELVNGRKVRCLVCRSQNRADDYRRLLVRLRFDGAQPGDHADQWS